MTALLEPKICYLNAHISIYLKQAREAVDNYGVEAVIDELVDEVVAPIQQAVVVETWREVVEASRDVQVTKVTDYPGNN